MDRTALKTAAAKYGTPLYLFDLDAFTARAEKVRAAFGSHVQLCYSMKANPFVLRGLPDVFRWVEVCSPGELTICEKLGIAPERILYSGVNKGADDVARAVALGAVAQDTGLFVRQQDVLVLVDDVQPRRRNFQPGIFLRGSFKKLVIDV